MNFIFHRNKGLKGGLGGGVGDGNWSLGSATVKSFIIFRLSLFSFFFQIHCETSLLTS